MKCECILFVYYRHYHYHHHMALILGEITGMSVNEIQKNILYIRMPSAYTAGLLQLWVGQYDCE